MSYRIPDGLRNRVANRRVAIVNDVINAGSAVRGTFAALLECGATVVAIGTLLSLGPDACEFASSKSLIFESIATMPHTLWVPSECPMCSSGVPLECMES